MYLPIEFTGYNYRDVSDEDYAELRSVIPTIPADKPEYTILGTHFLTESAIPVVTKLELEFRVSQDQQTGVSQMLVKLQDRIEELELKEHKRNLAKLAAEGAAVQIAVPNMALMSIREVDYLDNACTDMLQDKLDEGWMILAVCPPNSQRRPDYILGKAGGILPTS